MSSKMSFQIRRIREGRFTEFTHIRSIRQYTKLGLPVTTAPIVGVDGRWSHQGLAILSRYILIEIGRVKELCVASHGVFIVDLHQLLYVDTLHCSRECCAAHGDEIDWKD